MQESHFYYLRLILLFLKLVVIIPGLYLFLNNHTLKQVGATDSEYNAKMHFIYHFYIKNKAGMAVENFFMDRTNHVIVM